MELRQLVYFEAVARHGGFSRAAEQLRIAQPAVSAQIRRLESELGTTLLQRTTRRVALTHAGELFLARTRAVPAPAASASHRPAPSPMARNCASARVRAFGSRCSAPGGAGG